MDQGSLIGGDTLVLIDIRMCLLIWNSYSIYLGHFLDDAYGNQSLPKNSASNA